MKKFLCITLSCILLFCLSACKEQPRDILTVKNEVNFSKDGVAEFMALPKPTDAQISTEEFCYNVTPDNIAKLSEYQIFRFTDNNATFLVIDEKVYSLTPWGKCFINAELWDYDADGSDDLLFTAFRDVENHRGGLFVFNVKTQKLTDIATAEKEVIVFSGVPAYAEEGDLAETSYVVFEAAVTSDSSIPSLTYQAQHLCGRIDTVNGTPIYLPNELPEFDFAEVQKTYPEGTPGVCTEGFVNTKETELTETKDAIARALKEIAVPYDSISVSYDRKANVWNIGVGLTNTTGGQTVYMTDKGVTLMSIQGE